MSHIFNHFRDTIEIFFSFKIPHNFSDEEIKAITTSRIICSGISIFACLWIIILYAIMCVKLRCTKRRSSLVRQKTEATSEIENLNSSLVNKESNNYDLVIQSRYKSVWKSSRNSKNSEKMGIGNDLIFFLILSNLGWCIGTFLGIEGFNSEEDRKSPNCIAQAFVQNFFDISSICFTTLISRVTLMGTTKCYADFSKVKNRMCHFLLYATLCPLALSLGPYFTDSLGCSGAWCWIDFFNMNSYSYLWTILIYAFDWVNIMYIIYALIVASQYFEKRKAEINCDQTKSRELHFLHRYVLILKAFPIILMINRLPSLINRAYSLFFKRDSFSLFMMHSIALGLGGFFNSVIYSFFYRSLFRCCRTRKENSELDIEHKNEFNTGINGQNN